MSTAKTQPLPPKPSKRSNQTKCFGPISDLERHLPSDWWRTLFNAMYLKTDGDIVENDLSTVREVDFLLKETPIKLTDKVLDLCCGQGRHCFELSKRGYKNLTGVDRSRYLIRLARKRAKQSSAEINFHEGDARKLRKSDNNYDYVMLLGNSFGYFDSQKDDLSVLDAVKKVLKPGGSVVLDLSDGDWIRANYQPRSWEWIDEHHFVCRERSLSKDQDRLISREVITHVEKGVLVDQFYAERLYSKEQINVILKKVGFENSTFHGEVITTSSRDQDLGMMAHRLFITAKAPAKINTGEVLNTKTPAQKVTVLLGDPQLPDSVKLNGKFNPEDLDTVQRLKTALNELKDFKFSYLNDHKTLTQDLKENRPDFILNLCDEGYLNDATKELHVPAILETLDIPYTGSAPAGLAVCYNKAWVRGIAQSLNIPVPLETYFDQDDQLATLPSAFPVIVKPNTGDSSIGITKDAVIYNADDLVSRINYLRQTLPGRSILVQEYLTGSEYSVGIIGNPGLSWKILPPLEVDYTQLDSTLPKILGYESKWELNSAYCTQIQYKEARNDEEVRRKLLDYASVLFERLECRDYARFDFRTDSNGEIKLLEVNPNPGWCHDGKLNMMASWANLKYVDMLKLILEAAQERILNKSSK